MISYDFHNYQPQFCFAQPQFSLHEIASSYLCPTIPARFFGDFSENDLQKLLSMAPLPRFLGAQHEVTGPGLPGECEPRMKKPCGFLVLLNQPKFVCLSTWGCGSHLVNGSKKNIIRCLKYYRWDEIWTIPGL